MKKRAKRPEGGHSHGKEAGFVPSTSHLLLRLRGGIAVVVAVPVSVPTVDYRSPSHLLMGRRRGGGLAPGRRLRPHGSQQAVHSFHLAPKCFLPSPKHFHVAPPHWAPVGGWRRRGRRRRRPVKCRPTGVTRPSVSISLTLGPSTHPGRGVGGGRSEQALQEGPKATRLCRAPGLEPVDGVHRGGRLRGPPFL